MNLIKLLSCVCLLGIALYAHHANARQPLDKIVAIVNDQVISESELNKYEKVLGARIKQQGGATLPPKTEWQKQVLNHMIAEKIQLQLAKQLGIEIDGFAVSQAIEEMARVQNTTIEQLKRETEKQGFHFNDFREFIRVQMTLQSLHAREIGQDITVSKHEVESFLNSTAGQDQSGTEYQLGHILLALPEAPTPQILQKAQAEAEQLAKDLRSHLDFSKTAMTKSTGRHALNGGDLGWRTAAELPTLFVNYVPTMNVGDIVGPIRTTGGLHIIKLLDKRTKDIQAELENHVLQIVITPSNTLTNERFT
jgi:peptidyl-prolyl cis-trans isomerase SurA